MNKLSPMKNSKSDQSFLQSQHDQKAFFRDLDKKEAKSKLKQKRKEKQSKRFEAWGE